VCVCVCVCVCVGVCVGARVKQKCSNYENGIVGGQRQHNLGYITINRNNKRGVA
jgi:hypothetical protein